MPKFRSPDNAAGEQTSRVNRDGRQIACQNEGSLRRKEKDVTRFHPDGRLLTLDTQPAIALHQGEELDLIRRREANGPRTSGGETARHDSFSVREPEDVGE